MDARFAASIVATCHTCGRVLDPGESAWADDWTVIDEQGARHELRLTCDECEAKR